MPDYVLILTTCSPDSAEHLGMELVKSKNCACVNIIPGINSIYHWKGKIQRDNESILVLKTERRNVQSTWKELRKHHPYEIPEFVVVNVSQGSPDYLKWISESIS